MEGNLNTLGLRLSQNFVKKTPRFVVFWRRLRPRIFLTFRHYKGGRSSAKHTGRLYPRRNPWYSLSEAESTSGHMVLSGVPRKKSPVTPPGIDPGASRLVAQCLNHYATPGSLKKHYHIQNITKLVLFLSRDIEITHSFVSIHIKILLSV